MRTPVFEPQGFSRNPKFDIWRARLGCVGASFPPVDLPTLRGSDVRRPEDQRQPLGSLAGPGGVVRPRRPQPCAPGGTRIAKRSGARAARSNAIHPYSTTSAGSRKGLKLRCGHDTAHRREKANMRATLMVARELLRCRLIESGRDALLERVA